MEVLLVRHAAAVVTGAEPPSEWLLSSDGIEGAERLGLQLARQFHGRSPVNYASSERKAIQTAALISTADVIVDPRLGEVQKPWYERSEDHEAAAVRYLDGHDVPGWEPQSAASGRFDEAIREIGDQFAVCATHGTVMSLWLSHQLQAFDPIPFWRKLSFPDAHLITNNHDSLSVTHLA